MEKKDSLPDFLIEGFLMGNLSHDEEKELLKWVRQSPGHADALQETQELLRKKVIANSKKQTDEPWTNLWDKLHSQGHKTVTHTKQASKIWLRVAAAAAVIAVAFVAYSVFRINPPAEEKLAETMQKATTLYGERTSLTLPDGTKVKLNSGSTIVYPSTFADDCRKVELVGEAFFEVTHNEHCPFIVSARGLNIKVLGTIFNLEAYPDSKEINTTLVSGKVALEKVDGNGIVPLTELKPYERAVYNLADHQVKLTEEENLDHYIAWKDGKLVFFKSPIEELAHKLGLWFDVQVTIKSDELRDTHFTGTFTNESLEKVLSLLSVSYPIQYKIVKTEKYANNGEVVLSIKK